MNNRIMVHFDFPKGTQKQYDGVWDDLKASGYEHPNGLIFHAGAPKQEGGWFVLDIWESQKAFDDFGKVLMPLIQKHGLDAVPPRIMKPHLTYQNVYQTQREGVLS